MPLPPAPVSQLWIVVHALIELKYKNGTHRRDSAQAPGADYGIRQVSPPSLGPHSSQPKLTAVLLLDNPHPPDTP